MEMNTLLQNPLSQKEKNAFRRSIGHISYCDLVVDFGEEFNIITDEAKKYQGFIIENVRVPNWDDLTWRGYQIPGFHIEKKWLKIHRFL